MKHDSNNTETFKVRVTATRESTGRRVSLSFSMTIHESDPVTDAIDAAIELFRERFADADDDLEAEIVD